MPRKPGRPRLALDRRKTDVFRVRATASEIAAFRRIAYRAGESASKLLRDHIRHVLTASASLLR